MDKRLLYILPVFVLLGIFLFSMTSISPIQSNDINHEGYFIITQSSADGTIISKEISHNLLYNSGRNITRDLLINGGNGAFNIEIGNASAVTGTVIAAGTESFTAYTNCGFANAAGTVSVNTVGNGTISKIFTYTCDGITSNTTEIRIVNASGSLFSGFNPSIKTFTTTGETLNVTYQFGVL